MATSSEPDAVLWQFYLPKSVSTLLDSQALPRGWRQRIMEPLVTKLVAECAASGLTNGWDPDNQALIDKVVAGAWAKPELPKPKTKKQK